MDIEMDIEQIAQLFDKCFKYLMQRLSDKPTIAFINGLFDEQYPLNGTVVQLNSEFITVKLEKKLADGLLSTNSRQYHVEVQIKNDTDIVIRLVEYGFGMAERSPADKEGIITMTFPKQYLIYLESNKGTPDEEQVLLQFPDGGHYLYRVPVLKLADHSIEELEQKGLYALLPFVVLNLRKAVRQAKSSEEKSGLAEELRHMLVVLREFFREQVALDMLTNMDELELLRVLEDLNANLYKEEAEFKEVLGMFEDWDSDPRVIAAKKLDEEVARRVAVQQQLQEERQRCEALELELQQFRAAAFVQG
jgi:hypothetical protein